MIPFLLIFTLAFSGPVTALQHSRPSPLIIAHRGASAVAPENTLAAFKKAMALHSDAIELDVRQTRDSQLVVLHDATVDRTTNGEGDIASMTLSEARQLDAGSWFHPRFKDERIPTLQEVVQLLDTATLLIIEIKGDEDIYPGIEERVIEAVKAHRLETRVILKSFDTEVLARIKRRAPTIPVLYVYVFAIPLLGMTIDHGVSVGNLFDLNVDYLQPHKIIVTESFVREAHERGFKVVVWDVHDESTMKDMIDLGVDGIETDFPDVLYDLLHQRR